MKAFFRDWLVGILLAIGAMLTLFAAVVAVGTDDDKFVTSSICGLIGIPLLFATLSQIGRRDQV